MSAVNQFLKQREARKRRVERELATGDFVLVENGMFGFETAEVLWRSRIYMVVRMAGEHESEGLPPRLMRIDGIEAFGTQGEIEGLHARLGVLLDAKDEELRARQDVTLGIAHSHARQMRREIRSFIKERK